MAGDEDIIEVGRVREQGTDRVWTLWGQETTCDFETALKQRTKRLPFCVETSYGRISAKYILY